MRYRSYELISFHLSVSPICVKSIDLSGERVSVGRAERGKGKLCSLIDRISIIFAFLFCRLREDDLLRVPLEGIGVEVKAEEEGMR